MKKVAILHEGNSKKTHDNELIKLLIQDLGLDDSIVEYYGFGSKSNFFKLDNPKYKNLKLRVEEEEISKILFVIDADYEENDNAYGGTTKTTSELNKVITGLNISNNSQVYVTCDPSTNDGYLESLILSTIPKVQKDCIENFLDCSNFSSKENHKAILHNIYKLAYPKSPFDFNHQNFDRLKSKLNWLIEE